MFPLLRDFPCLHFNLIHLHSAVMAERLQVWSCYPGWDFASLASMLELLHSPFPHAERCTKSPPSSRFRSEQSRCDVSKRHVCRSVWYGAICAIIMFFQERRRARSADQRFGHTPAGRQIEDLQVIKSGACTTEATQSCTNCACARTRISPCLHGFF